MIFLTFIVLIELIHAQVYNATAFSSSANPLPIDQSVRRKSCPDGYQQLGKQCARIVQIEPQYNCLNGGTLQPDGTCVRRFAKNSECASGFTRDGGVCTRIRTASRNIVCGESYSLRADNTCVRLEQLPDKDACPVGSEAKGSTCVIQTLEAPILDCPEGFQLQGRACVIEETYDCTPAHPVVPRSGFIESKNVGVAETMLNFNNAQNINSQDDTASNISQSNTTDSIQIIESDSIHFVDDNFNQIADSGISQFSGFINNAEGFKGLLQSSDIQINITDDGTRSFDNDFNTVSSIQQTTQSQNNQINMNQPSAFTLPINIQVTNPEQMFNAITNTQRSQQVQLNTQLLEQQAQVARLQQLQTEQQRLQQLQTEQQRLQQLQTEQQRLQQLQTEQQRLQQLQTEQQRLQQLQTEQQRLQQLQTEQQRLQQLQTEQQRLQQLQTEQQRLQQLQTEQQRLQQLQTEQQRLQQLQTEQQRLQQLQTEQQRLQQLQAEQQRLQQLQTEQLQLEQQRLQQLQAEQLELEQQRLQNLQAEQQRFQLQLEQQNLRQQNIEVTQQIQTPQPMQGQITQQNSVNTTETITESRFQRPINSQQQSVAIAPTPTIPVISYASAPYILKNQRLSVMSPRRLQTKTSYASYNPYSSNEEKFFFQTQVNQKNFQSNPNRSFFTQPVGGIFQSNITSVVTPIIRFENDISQPLSENIAENNNTNNIVVISQENRQQTVETNNTVTEQVDPVLISNNAIVGQITLENSDIASRFQRTNILPLNEQVNIFTQPAVIDDYIAASTCRRIRMQPATKVCRQGVLDGKMCRVDSYIQPIRTFGGVAEEVVPAVSVCPQGFSPSRDSQDTCIVQDEMLPTFICPAGSRDAGTDCVVTQNSVATCDPGFALEGNLCAQTQFVPQTVEYTVTYACVGKECA